RHASEGPSGGRAGPARDLGEGRRPRSDETERFADRPPHSPGRADRRAHQGGAGVRSVNLVALFALVAVPRTEAAAPASEPFDIAYLSQSRPVIVRLKIDSSGQPLREAWNAFVNALFDRLDADKNGIIDEKEEKKFKTLLSLLGSGNNPQQARQLQRMRNGQPMPRPPETPPRTRSELADYLVKHDLGPLRLPPPYNPQPQMNGFFSRGRQPSAEDLNKALLEYLDADKDGKLSAKELEAGVAILA